MRRTLAVVVLVLGSLLAACVTRAEVEEIVQASNETTILLQQSERFVSDPAAGGEVLAVDPAAVSALVARIDVFIAQHPDMKATNDALRVRKAMILMAAGRMNGARASFAAVEGELLNDRDRALAASHETLIWWREVAVLDDADALPGREDFEAGLAALEGATRDLDPTSIDIRFYLAEIRAWMALKLVMPVLVDLEDDALVPTIAELLRAPLADYLAIFSAEEAAQLAIVRDLETVDAEGLRRLPLERLRWMFHARILVREYARVARLAAEVFPDLEPDWPERARPLLP